MAEPTVSVTLYGGKARRFREIKDTLEDRRGWEPDNSEVVAALMVRFDEDAGPRPEW